MEGSEGNGTGTVKLQHRGAVCGPDKVKAGTVSKDSKERSQFPLFTTTCFGQI